MFLFRLFVVAKELFIFSNNYLFVIFVTNYKDVQILFRCLMRKNLKLQRLLLDVMPEDGKI